MTEVGCLKPTEHHQVSMYYYKNNGRGFLCDLSCMYHADCCTFVPGSQEMSTNQAKMWNSIESFSVISLIIIIIVPISLFIAMGTRELYINKLVGNFGDSVLYKIGHSKNFFERSRPLFLY